MGGYFTDVRSIDVRNIDHVYLSVSYPIPNPSAAPIRCHRTRAYEGCEPYFMERNGSRY